MAIQAGEGGTMVDRPSYFSDQEATVSVLALYASKNIYVRPAYTVNVLRTVVPQPKAWLVCLGGAPDKILSRSLFTSRTCIIAFRCSAVQCRVHGVHQEYIYRKRIEEGE